ncbi:hypothetical protein Pfo_018070 [Paulownia fortunei]|nr:hypothetical protein Pfo_018070 [Paulownia fortunei]
MGHTANVGENSESKPEPACWPDSVEKILIELMVKEVQSGNRPSTTLTKKGWRHIEKGLYEKTNRTYSYSQLRNKFNQLRIRYQDFSKLLKEPGFIWDPSRNSLMATDAVWKSYRKANKNMRRFRGKGCPMFNELGIIFQENCQVYFQTANCSVDAESTGASPSASPDNTSNCKDHPSVDVGCSQQRSPTPGSRILEKKEARTTAKGSTEWNEITVPSTASDKKWTESSDTRVPPIKNVGEYPDSAGFSITNCVKCLESIEGVDSNTYLKAIKMFKDADWREMFMAMSARRRLDWLASLK